LVREVELTREFFSEAKGKYTEGADRVIAEMKGMLLSKKKGTKKGTLVQIQLDFEGRGEYDRDICRDKRDLMLRGHCIM
jgi:hypothetical protein